MKLRRRIGSVFLAFAMALSLIPSVAVSALAAGGDAEQYVTATFSDNSGNRDVTVKVVGPNGEDFGTHTYNDVGGGANTITLTLTDTADGQYDIESVENDSQSGNWHSITNETLSSNSYSCLYSSSNDLTLTVSLVPNYTEPDLPNGTIDNGTLTRVYRLYDDQILKMLHANDIQVSVETTIKSVKPTWVNSFGEDHRAFDDINLADADYWNLSVTGATADDVQPNNIRKLTITYDNGNGEETVDIYSGDLSYPIENDTAAGVTQHYNIELNNDTFHIVYFYDVTGVNTTVYSLYDIAFVNHNGIVDDEMPADPTYPNTRYEFVCWTETPDGGRPFLETTPVTKDTILYSQKALSTVESYSPYIYVMNDDNLFKTRLNELFGTSDIDLATVEVTVCGESGAQTNPDYEAGHLVDNGWSEDDEYYLVYNYQPGAEGSGQGNQPVHINDINKIIVTADKLNGDPLGQVEILKGIYDGEFWVSTGTLDSDMIINLYINDNGVENPNLPDPGTDPAITDFTKTLVSSEQDATKAGITDTSTYTFPNEDNKVIIPYDESVTLLYAIKVTGTAGTEFTVTDEGAELVSTNVGVIGNNDTFTGSIPDNAESITFYVSKTFTAANLTDASEGDGTVLTNNASITSEDGVQEGEGEDGEETPAEEETYKVYTYVQFVKEDNKPLDENDEAEIKELYGGEVNNDGYVAIGTFEIPMPDPTEKPYAPDPSGAGGPNVIEDKQYAELWEAVQKDLTEDNFTPISNEIKIDLDDIEKWVKLSTAHGALDFDEELTADCWHLDGQIQLYAPDISLDKELTSVQRDGQDDPITTGLENMTLEVGDQLTWTITVTNSGNKEATGLKLSDTLTVEPADGTARTAKVTDAEGKEVDGSYTFTVSAATDANTPGEVEFTATYTVQDTDKGLTLKNTATVSDGDGDTEDDPSGDTENPVAERKVSIEKKLTSATRDGQPVYNSTTDTLESYKAQVGDVLSYTITVENTGNVDLENVKVTDSLWNSKEVIGSISWDPEPDNYFVDYDGSATFNLDADETVTITYTYTVQDSDVAAGEIKNTAGVYLDDGDTPDPSDEPDGKDDVTVEMDDYTIDIAPANITIYTGGTGYAGVLENVEGVLLDEPTSGLPEPGYHIELPDAVNAWLKEQGVDTSEATHLDQILRFAYDVETDQREWGMSYVGVYELHEDGTPAQYVYSLNPAMVGDKEIPVSILFTDDAGTPVTSDDIDMSATAASAKYTISINPGGLKQNKIQAVFTVTADDETEKSITCNVEVGTGELTVKSTTNDEFVNEIGTVDGNQISATGEGVTYYVNDTQVTVDSSRVGLLVDSVSNNEDFNANMENDAISKVNGVSNALAQSYYLDLVDTDNGNAVVTPSDDVTIYWPMPDDADPNGDFYIVHYTEMDRENTTMQENPTVTKVDATANDNHLTFTTDSFSPFVLVYEQKDSGTVTPPPDDDKPTPPPVDPDKPQLNTEDHYAYIVGYEDGTVRPEGDITRAEVATIFFRLLTDESRDEYWSQTNDYTDVAEGDWYNNAVSTLSNAGILNGYEDGSFQPNGNITRAEFATIAARFFEATYEGEDLFPDIEGHWARDYINQAAHAGIVNGYEDGTFQPQENITRAEAMTIVNRTLDRHPDADHFLDNMVTWPDNPEDAWYYEQVQEATNSHEYVMKTDADKNPYEIWKEILPVRDWSDLENTWSEAHAG